MRFLATALILSAATTAPQERPLPFDKAWDLEGERTVITRDGDRQVLQVETGFAHRRDVSIEDGTIDFDVHLTKRRSFVYVYFRVAGDGEREEFYLRPHKSALPDAVQYAPVWQDRSAWQLHHGPGGTAAVRFDHDAWTHVRVVMRGRQAALFVGDMTTPALLVPRLAREPRAGSVSLGGFLPADVPGHGPIARFANVTVSTDVRFDFTRATQPATPAAPGPPTMEPEAAVIRAWSVSRAFVPAPGGAAVLPGADATKAFTRFETEPDGLLELHRYVTTPPGSRVAAAVARVTLHADRAGSYALDLGFSDIATVFVNGTPVFRGDASYSFDRPRREGLIGFDQARLYLPLVAGDNDLSVVVSDSFGGWGIQGRVVGVEVR